jgi:hypothetical protein
MIFIRKFQKKFLKKFDVIICDIIQECLVVTGLLIIESFAF